MRLDFLGLDRAAERVACHSENTCAVGHDNRVEIEDRIQDESEDDEDEDTNHSTGYENKLTHRSAVGSFHPVLVQ
jgi:hypothetical protein